MSTCPAHPETQLKLLLDYDGTSYLGWQKSSEGQTIEALLESAIERLLQHKISLNAASRTDRGVHAQGQVATFKTAKPIDMQKFIYSLNRILPREIRILQVEEVPLLFHPTTCALHKEYHYLIDPRTPASPFTRLYSWNIITPLNISAMREAASILIGEHDFSAFANQKSCSHPIDPIRRLLAIEIEENELILFKLRGNSFLYKMVRNLVGTLVYVGLGKFTPSDVQHILIDKKRILAGVTAPAHGLTLKKVVY